MATKSRPYVHPPVTTEIWAIAWPRPPHLSRPLVVVITALGTEGARLHISQRLPEGTTLELCFALPEVDVEVVCGAAVTDVTARGRIAVTFTLLEYRDRERLEAWVTHSRHTAGCRDTKRSVS